MIYLGFHLENVGLEMTKAQVKSKSIHWFHQNGAGLCSVYCGRVMLDMSASHRQEKQSTEDRKRRIWALFT